MLTDLIPYFLVLAKGLLVVVGLAFLCSGIDDLFIDVFHAIRSLYRRIFVLPKIQPLTEDHLLLPAEQPIAILIPAWDESAVIQSMLDNTLRSVNYSNYHIFIGTYPNDPATHREVEVVRERHPNVHRILCPKDGPTNKADCLNWVYQGILVFEKEADITFAIFVMEDSEDIVHPLSLKLFNYLVPRMDMVQLPVFPLETDWYRFTPGHYVDEFAENHSKDLLVRERLTKSIPSAGVGCAFSRRALELVARDKNNQLFSIDSLTEDYDFGFRLTKHHLKQIFVRQAIERISSGRSFWTRKPRQVTVKEYIAVREFFPTKFWASVRQKARWVLGIALQGWATLGWQGDYWFKYMLFRDRKSVVTNQVNVLGYVVVATVAALHLHDLLVPDAYHYPPLVEQSSWVWKVIWADTVLLGVRTFQRAYYVKAIYGWPQAFTSIPRQIWGNVINFVASVRALYLFARYLVTGQLIAWDKTAHVFPLEEELKTYRRKLGDLLLEKRFLTVKQLDEALARQKEVSRPLGTVLLEMGLVKEDDLVQILGTQLRLSTSEIDPYETPLDLLRVLPRSLAVQYSVYPVEVQRGRRLLLAANNPLSRPQVEQLEKALEQPVEICLSTRSDISFAIHRGYERLEQADENLAQKSSLGQLLVQRNIITAEQLREGLRAQRRSFARLGDILLGAGAISQEALQEALSEYSQNQHGRFGDFLVQGNYITFKQLEQALDLQKTRFRPLGDVLVELRMIDQEALKTMLGEQHAA